MEASASEPGAPSGARIFDVGYRRYDGRAAAASGAVRRSSRHSVQRVLGLHRGFRHKVLPAIAVVHRLRAGDRLRRASRPCSRTILGHDDILPSYGEYYGFITVALALFAALRRARGCCAPTGAPACSVSTWRRRST